MGAVAGFFGIMLLMLLAYAAYLFPSVPGGNTIREATSGVPSTVVDVRGREISTFDPLNREWVTLDSIPEHVVQALLVTEDRRFYEHGGLDIRRTFAAVGRSARGDTQGGSTITQQLARNLFPEEIGRSTTIGRKLKEMIAAVRIERSNSKEQILESYLNTVPFLYNAFGLERAAQTYFSKSAQQLTVSEGAVLVAMLKGTSSYNPVRNPERALERRNLVISLMAQHGMLDADEAQSIREQDLGLNFDRARATQSRAPHFTQHLQSILGDWAQRRGYNLHTSGLVIHTTLDLDLQTAAEEAVRRHGERLQGVADRVWTTAAFDRLYARNPAMVERHLRQTESYRLAIAGGESHQAAIQRLRSDEEALAQVRAGQTRVEAGLVAIDPREGHVRAWVGSRNYFTSEYDRVAVSRRQPGSAFKPVVYAAALRSGFSPMDRFPDEVMTFQLDGGRQSWTPTNVGGATGQMMTLTDALVHSKNTITAQLMQQVGPRRVAALGREMGISESTLDPVPALSLGSSAVTLLEMTNVYATLAADGYEREPTLVTRIEDRNGRVLEQFTPRSRQALPARTARTVVDMLRGVITRGTGTGVLQYGLSNYDLAGKTGTSQNGADGWFVMMHPELVAGAWVGFNDPAVTFGASGFGQGSRTALPIVGDFFGRSRRWISASARFPDSPQYGPSEYQMASADADSLGLEDSGSFLGRARGWFSDRFGGADAEAEMERRRVERERFLEELERRQQPAESQDPATRRIEDERAAAEVERQRQEAEQEWFERERQREAERARMQGREPAPTPQTREPAPTPQQREPQPRAPQPRSTQPQPRERDPAPQPTRPIQPIEPTPPAEVDGGGSSTTTPTRRGGW